jgi:NitT/TauT family transport system ATP-binding protein
MIEVERLCKTYMRRGGQGPLHVIEDVSFTLNDGEFLGIIGRSGCGKTTLLKILAGLVDYDSGEIRIDGRPFAGPGPDRRMVFQDFALLPWRTVAGNVEFGLEAKGIGKAERQRLVSEALEAVGLSNFARSYPKQLSGGMQQRVGVARALAVGTRTLLMDEPFGSLDAQTKRSLQDDLLRLAEGTGKSILFVTHDMDEAVLLCDRIIVMATNPGRIVEVVDTTRAIPRPRAGHIEKIKSLPDYAELVNHVWSTLARFPGVASGPSEETGPARSSEA